MAISSRQILKEINCKLLDLQKGYGYWYFVYDDVENNIFKTRSVPSMYLNQMPLSIWVEEGKDFVKEVFGEQQ